MAKLMNASDRWKLQANQGNFVVLWDKSEMGSYLHGKTIKCYINRKCLLLLFTGYTTFNGVDYTEVFYNRWMAAQVSRFN